MEHCGGLGAGSRRRWKRGALSSVAYHRFLWPFVRQELGAYLLGALLILLSSGFLVGVPALVGEAITCLETGVRVDMVPLLALAMVGVVLLRALTAYWMRMVTIGASRRIEYRLRNRLFRHLEDLDPGFHARMHTGDLMNRFTSDMEAVRSSLGPGVMYTLNTFATLAIALGLMFRVSVPLTFYSLIPLALLTVVFRSLGPRVHKESMTAQERLSDISVHAQENFSNVKMVKAFVRERSEIERMRALSDRYFEQNLRLARLRSTMMALLWLIGDLVVLSLIALGGYEIIAGRIGIGEFAAFKGCQLLLIWPMTALGWVLTLFQRGAVSAKRLGEILEAVPAVNDEHAIPGTALDSGRIHFRHLAFAYGDAAPVLRDIELEVPAGRTLGIVGPTGAGKSTLLALIPRLHPLPSGRLFVDGHSVERIPLATLRDAIGYVPQEPFLFSATVEDNITFGVDDATPEAVVEVARLVRIHDEILDFPAGYQQRVGERGITLSGGQKQRIALARALLKRPRILLLDDVLSAVDARTESEILAGLERWTADLTTILVTHRLSTVRHADEIVVLLGGEVAERGSHAELLAHPGYYARIHRRQSLEEELESL